MCFDFIEAIKSFSVARGQTTVWCGRCVGGRWCWLDVRFSRKLQEEEAKSKAKRPTCSQQTCSEHECYSDICICLIMFCRSQCGRLFHWESRDNCHFPPIVKYINPRRKNPNTNDSPSCQLKRYGLHQSGMLSLTWVNFQCNLTRASNWNVHISHVKSHIVVQCEIMFIWECLCDGQTWKL